jgi:WD40 repeat protein
MRLAFAPDGKTLASMSEDRTVKLWNLANRRPQTIEYKAPDEVVDLAFSGDGKTLAVADKYVIKLWDAVQSTEQKSIRVAGGDDFIISVACAPNGKTVAVTHYGHAPTVFDLATGKERARLSMTHAAYILAYSPDSKTLALGGDSFYGPLLWSWAQPTGQSPFNDKESPRAKFVAYTLDGTKLVWTGEYGGIYLWENGAPKEKLQTWTVPLRGHSGNTVLAPDGRHLLIAGGAGVYILRIAPTPKG